MINPFDTKSFTEITPKDFELTVKEILEASSNELIDFNAIHREKIGGLDGKYEIDVTARFRAIGVSFLVLVECKHHIHPIKRETVQILKDRISSTGAQKGIIFSRSNFQSGAIEYAKTHGIALVRIIEGRLTYETRALGQAADPPPWVKIPPYIGKRFQMAENGSITMTLISRDLPDDLDIFLNE